MGIVEGGGQIVGGTLSGIAQAFSLATAGITKCSDALGRSIEGYYWLKEKRSTANKTSDASDKPENTPNGTNTARSPSGPTVARR